MSPVQRGAVVLGIFAMVVGAPLVAHAAPPDEHAIRLEYTAHEGCPDALGFFWYVRARTQHVRLAAPGETADLAKINIVRSGDRSLGTLELPPFEGRPFSREVEAPTCADVVLALSLVVALAYDPDATTTFSATITAPPAPEPPVPAQSPEPAIAPPTVQEPEPTREATSPTARARHGGAAGVAVLGSGGAGPSLQILLAPFVEYSAKAMGLWQPRVRGTFLVELPAATVSVEPIGPATLQLFAGQVEGCPISVHITADIAIFPCIGVDAGALVGRASNTVPGAQSGTLWRVALDGSVRLRSTLAGPLFAELTATGNVNLLPGKFVFLDSSSNQVDVYNLPNPFGSFGLGLGVYFP
jgi:hypothetical protein